MEFIEAMGIMKRMCLTSNGCCECPMYETLKNSFYNCMGFFQNCPEKAEAILKKWNAGHPVKTLKDVLNEAFPNVQKRERDVPEFCVMMFGYDPLCNIGECCASNCVKCWNQPYKEE